MLRNNWKPPDWRRAAGGGRRDEPGGQGGGGQRQQQNNNGESGQSGPEEVRQLVNDMERQDRRELAGDRKKMYQNAMQLMQRRKTASRGNIVTFLFNDRNAFIDKQGVINNVLRMSGFTPSNVLSLKMNDFRNNECEVMFKDDVTIDCDEIEEKIRKNGMNVSVSKFIETEEICMVYGMPLTSDVEGMKEQIRETISPFVRRVVSITATTHYGKNENDFFHGRLTGDYKVKVVPLNEGQIPYYVSIGDQHVMGRVHYVRKMMDKKVMCDACFSTAHMMRDPECPGVRDWQDYVKEFEEMRDVAIQNFDASSSGPAPAPSFVSRNAELKRLSEEVVDLQARNLALENEKMEYCKKLDEMLKSQKSQLPHGPEDSFNSSMEQELPGTLGTPTNGTETLVSAESESESEDAKRKNSGQNFVKKLVPGDLIWIQTPNRHIPLASFLKHLGNDQSEVGEMDSSGQKIKKKHKLFLAKCKWDLITNYNS